MRPAYGGAPMWIAQLIDIDELTGRQIHESRMGRPLQAGGHRSGGVGLADQPEHRTALDLQWRAVGEAETSKFDKATLDYS